MTEEVETGRVTELAAKSAAGLVRGNTNHQGYPDQENHSDHTVHPGNHGRGASGACGMQTPQSVPLCDLQIPEEEDCSTDTVPPDAVDMRGKKKILVPEFISMKKVLFDRYRLEMYRYLNDRLRKGWISTLAGRTVTTRRITHEECSFPEVIFWRIDRGNFYADVEVELKLDTVAGHILWKGYLVCWCGFDDDLFCEIEDLTDCVADKNEGFDMLSPYLIPYATNQRVDKISEEILELHQPEALTDPNERNAVKLAASLGLKIEYYPVYEHQGVHSILFFKEQPLLIGEDRTEKGDDGKKRRIKAASGKQIIIPANTIVVNTNQIARKFSALDIYHECYHYEEHYLFFRLQELGSDDHRVMKAKEVIVDEYHEQKDPLYFLEKQANRGAYGLMMPATHTRERIHELRSREGRYNHSGELYQYIGKNLANELHVPDFRIRARMIQMGNNDAKGALNYVNREEIRPFAFSQDSLRDPRHTFVVDKRDVARLRNTHPYLDGLMSSEKYVYADGHVAINDERIVHKIINEYSREEKYVLTPWAEAHVDDCCLRFVRVYVQQSIGRYVYGRLYFDEELQKRDEFYLSDYINKRQLSLPDARYMYKMEFPGNFKDAFDKLMRQSGEKQESMADMLGTTSKSLRDWLNDPAHKITPDFVIIVSLIWKLPGWISNLLMENAGLHLNERDRRHRALQYIQDVMWDKGVQEANLYLNGQGLETLRVR